MIQMIERKDYERKIEQYYLSKAFTFSYLNLLYIFMSYYLDT